MFQNLRKAGRADWGKKARQTAGINDLKFAAQVQFFMQEAGIRTLHDFDEFVGKQQESLAQLDGVGKAIRKKQTALKHLRHFSDSSRFLTRAIAVWASFGSSTLKSIIRS